MTHPTQRASARTGGFTLIELLVVIGILGVLAAALLPRVLGASENANIFADQKNFDELYKMQVELRQRKSSPLPKDGGAKFVLAPWIYEICDHTESNRDRFFTPGQMKDDLRYQELMEDSPKDIWKSFDQITSEDTHYAGRAGEHYRSMWDGNEAMMANDGEYLAFQNGAINVLYGDGHVKTLYWVEHLRDLVGEAEGQERAIPVGPDCPVEELQKLRQ